MCACVSLSVLLSTYPVSVSGYCYYYCFSESSSIHAEMAVLLSYGILSIRSAVWWKREEMDSQTDGR